jgi:hypothetical protein
MLPNLPSYVNIVFVCTLFLTVWFLWKATLSPSVLAIALIWIATTGLLAYKGFFENTSGFPPRLAIAVLPILLLIIIVLIKGKRFIDSLDMRMLTLLSIVRIPVELCLYWLFIYKYVPQLMTFTGRNFDIIAGITAPIIYFVCFKGNKVSNRGLLLTWNIISLLLLLNIVVNAILAAPFAIQQFAFDQPNIAILYVPFVWLPAIIVMAVLFSHLAMIQRLVKSN